MKTIIIRDEDDNENEVLGVFLTDETDIEVKIDRYKQEWYEESNFSLMEYIMRKFNQENVNGMWVHNFSVVSI